MFALHGRFGSEASPGMAGCKPVVSGAPRARAPIGVLVGVLVACAGPIRSVEDATSPANAAASLRGASGLEIVPGDVPPHLEGEDALLVVHVDSDASIASLEAGGKLVAADLKTGRFIWLVRIPAGRYSWTEVGIAPRVPEKPTVRGCPRNRVAGIDPRRDLVGVRDAEFEFEVEKGKINYPGELILRVQYEPFCNMAQWLTLRNRNHSAMALQALTKTHAAVLDALPIRYAGASGDGFLDYYSRLTARGGAEPGGERE